MTTLRKDLEQHVQENDKIRLNEIEEITQDVRSSLKKVISQKTILRILCDKEEKDLQQVEANLKMIKEAIARII